MDLSGNSIDDFCMRSLGEYVQSNTCIEFMNFKKTCITDAGIEVLAHSLIGNSTFKKIDISQNKSISNKSLPMLLELTKSSHILDINIDHTSIAERNSLVIFLAENSIKYKSNKLHFNSKNLDKYGIRDICEFMKIYGIDNLQDINLMKNKIVSEGAGILFETLKECNSVITSLDLTENHIDHTCLKKLGEYVQDNEHLEVLYLTKNYISDTGIEVLSEYLVGNTTMVYFSVGSNKDITDDSVPYLEEIARKTHILDFDLSLTSITAGKKKALKELLKIPVEKREIPVRSNTKSAAKALSSSA